MGGAQIAAWADGRKVSLEDARRKAQNLHGAAVIAPECVELSTDNRSRKPTFSEIAARVIRRESAAWRGGIAGKTAAKWINQIESKSFRLDSRPTRKPDSSDPLNRATRRLWPARRG